MLHPAHLVACDIFVNLDIMVACCRYQKRNWACFRKGPPWPPWRISNPPKGVGFCFVLCFSESGLIKSSVSSYGRNSRCKYRWCYTQKRLSPNPSLNSGPCLPHIVHLHLSAHSQTNAAPPPRATGHTYAIATPHCQRKRLIFQNAP